MQVKRTIQNYSAFIQDYSELFRIIQNFSEFFRIIFRIIQNNIQNEYPSAGRIFIATVQDSLISCIYWFFVWVHLVLARYLQDVVPVSDNNYVDVWKHIFCHAFLYLCLGWNEHRRNWAKYGGMVMRIVFHACMPGASSGIKPVAVGETMAESLSNLVEVASDDVRRYGMDGPIKKGFTANNKQEKHSSSNNKQEEHSNINLPRKYLIHKGNSSSSDSNSINNNISSSTKYIKTTPSSDTLAKDLDNCVISSNSNDVTTIAEDVSMSKNLNKENDNKFDVPGAIIYSDRGEYGRTTYYIEGNIVQNCSEFHATTSSEDGVVGKEQILDDSSKCILNSQEIRKTGIENEKNSNTAGAEEWQEWNKLTEVERQGSKTRMKTVRSIGQGL